MVLKRLRKACTYWVEDQASQMGAALAYYALFSLAPLLMIAIAVTGQVYGADHTREKLVEWVRDVGNEETATAIQILLDNQRQLPSSLGPWMISLATLLIGAIGMFTQLQTSLGRIWRLQNPDQGVVVGLVRMHLLAFLMVLFTCAAVLVLLTGSTVLSVILSQAGHLLPGSHWSWRGVDFGVSALAVLLLLAFTYRFLSDGTVRYIHVWEGALVSAVLFTLGKMLIGFYLAHSQVMTAFGAAGSLVALLIWVYYSAQIFFFGAEVIRVRLNR
jgi:membrane protein